MVMTEKSQAYAGPERVHRLFVFDANHSLAKSTAAVQLTSAEEVQKHKCGAHSNRLVVSALIRIGTSRGNSGEQIMSSMAMINEFVSQPALALMGMSRSGKKFGNLAYRTLVSNGYRVYPIHPEATTIAGV